MRTVGAMILVAGLTLAVAGPTLAGEDDAVVSADGVCSAGSRYTIGMGIETGIDLEFGVEARVADHRFRVQLFYDGARVVNEVVLTGEDGGFEVRRIVLNQDGDDTLRIAARDLLTGETCNGQLRGEV